MLTTGGLTKVEAQRRHKDDGPNELTQDSRRALRAQVWEVISEPMIVLLIAAAIISLILAEPIDSVLLSATVVAVIGISLVQERRTESALDALRDLSAPMALVLRDGEKVRIPGREVVAGDLIFLSEGDRVPADAVLVDASNVSVDEAALTGESVPVQKRAAGDDLWESIRPGGDDSPWLFAGTLMVRGHGAAIVQHIADATELGRIGAALSGITQSRTHLQREVDRLVRIVAVVGLLASGTVVVVYGLTRGDWLEGLLAGIATTMALLPEEFPVILTVFMALGAWRMSKSKVLSRRSSMIETLGSVTVLCVDKTGTLTENSMTVSEFIVDGRSYQVQGSLHSAGIQAANIGALASPQHPFDPMDRAFRDIDERFLAETRWAQHEWDLVREYSLQPDLLAVGNVWRSNENELFVAAKGAPEAILKLCGISSDKLEKVIAQVEAAAERGERVVALATARWESAVDLPESLREMTFDFAGLAGLIDPVRAGVVHSVSECHAAGIRVVVITGDYPTTAQAIADEIGLDTSAGVVTGSELESMSDEQLLKRVSEIEVFARMIPEQKLRLIRAFQARGEVVGMTGDGVNDAPALRAADIGIAMGHRGTDVARESADLVIIDDDFSSIVAGVRQGRRIFDNLRKAMAYVVSIHVVVFGMALIPVFGPSWPLVLLPLQIALLELVIDPACSVAFESEEADHNIMKRPPRPQRQSLLSRRILGIALFQGLTTLVAVFLVFIWGIAQGLSEERVRTLTFTALMSANIMLILINRSWDTNLLRTIRERRNPAFRWILGFAIAAGAVLTTVPALQRAFRFESGSLAQTLLALLLGALGPIWFEAYKGRYGR